MFAYSDTVIYIYIYIYISKQVVVVYHECNCGLGFTQPFCQVLCTKFMCVLYKHQGALVDFDTPVLL